MFLNHSVLYTWLSGISANLEYGILLQLITIDKKSIYSWLLIYKLNILFSVKLGLVLVIRNLKTNFINWLYGKILDSKVIGGIYGLTKHSLKSW